jgi:hypothetical protein
MRKMTIEDDGCFTRVLSCVNLLSLCYLLPVVIVSQIPGISWPTTPLTLRPYTTASSFLVVIMLRISTAERQFVQGGVAQG